MFHNALMCYNIFSFFFVYKIKTFSCINKKNLISTSGKTFQQFKLKSLVYFMLFVSSSFFLYHSKVFIDLLRSLNITMNLLRGGLGNKLLASCLSVYPVCFEDNAPLHPNNVKKTIIMCKILWKKKSSTLEYPRNLTPFIY